MSYTLIDHTADIGIYLRSKDRVGLFEDAALALVEIMDVRSAEDLIRSEVRVEGIDLVDTLVRWLQELLYLIEVRDLRVSSIKVLRVGDTFVDAMVAGEETQTPYAVEIKAVTYHNLVIQELDNCLEATIIFDT